MEHNGQLNGSAKFAHLVARRQRERYVLTLYVTGLTDRSTRALAAIRTLYDNYLTDRYDLEIIDIYQHPELGPGAR